MLTESIHMLSEKYQKRYGKSRYEFFKQEKLPAYSKNITYKNNKRYYFKRNSFWYKLITLFFSIQRMLPENPYIFHSLAPSARGLNSNKIIIRIKNSLFEFFPKGNYLRLIAGEDFYLSKSCIDIRYISIYIVADLNNIGQIYGSFGWTLSLLDSGHLLEHIKQISQIYNIDNEVIFFPQRELKGYSNNFQRRDLFAIAKISFTTENQVRKAQIKRDNSVVIEKMDIAKDSTGVFEEILSYFDNSEEMKLNSYFTKSEEFTINQIYNRTSDNSYQGLSFFPYFISNSNIMKLARMLKKLIKLAFSSIEIFVLVKGIDHKNKKLIINKNSITIENSALNFDSVIHDAFEYVNTCDASIIIWTSLNKKVFSKLEMNECAKDVIDSARFIHCASLFLTKLGLVTRPMKNINEKYFENFVSKGRNLATYMLVAGKSMNEQLVVPIQS